MREKKKLLAVLGTVFVCLLCVWGLLLFTKDSAKNETWIRQAPRPVRIPGTMAAGRRMQIPGQRIGSAFSRILHRMRWNRLRFGMRRGIM